MFEIINNDETLIQNTLLAISNLNIKPEVRPIRGGTDGTEISFQGIPCPNLGTGGHNFHSVYEYICLEDMEKAREILISIVKQFSKKDIKTKIKK
jgi:tripeptide aminopeptidase